MTPLSLTQSFSIFYIFRRKYQNTTSWENIKIRPPEKTRPSLERSYHPNIIVICVVHLICISKIHTSQARRPCMESVFKFVYVHVIYMHT